MDAQNRRLIVAACSRSWELDTPTRTLKLRCNNRNNEECDNSGLASKSDGWTAVVNPFDLEVDDAEPT